MGRKERGKEYGWIVKMDEYGKTVEIYIIRINKYEKLIKIESLIKEK